MQETWSTISADDVRTEFTPMETAVLQNLQNATTNLDSLLVDVVRLVRTAYSDGGRELGPVANTIPEGCRSRAIALARWKFLISMPQLKSMQTDARKKSAEDAEAYFLLIAERKLSGSGGAQIVSSQPRQATRDRLDGLM